MLQRLEVYNDARDIIHDFFFSVPSFDGLVDQVTNSILGVLALVPAVTMDDLDGLLVGNELPNTVTGKNKELIADSINFALPHRCTKSDL